MPNKQRQRVSDRRLPPGPVARLVERLWAAGHRSTVAQKGAPKKTWFLRETHDGSGPWAVGQWPASWRLVPGAHQGGGLDVS